VVADPRHALARAAELAGSGGAVVAIGGSHLVGDLLSPAATDRASMF
jgi:hypothetical protein